MTGSPADISSVGRKLMNIGPNNPRVKVRMLGLNASFQMISSECSSYVGNDTGMMHVAASMGKPTLGIFNFPGTEVKNPPLCKRNAVMLGFTESGPPTPQMVYDTWKAMIDG
jgi:ADP-heptose:LPS heptosyltransferase